MTETLKAPARKRARFNALNVSEIRQLTTDAIEVAFRIPEELQDDYNYVPGQYVALRATIDGEETRRSYSICAEPVPGEIRVAIKKDFGGLFSTWAHEELTVGDTINVMNPQGSFTSRLHSTALNDPEAIAEEHSSQGGHFVAIAAGSGITPIMSIVSTLLNSSETATLTAQQQGANAGFGCFGIGLGELGNRSLIQRVHLFRCVEGDFSDVVVNFKVDHVSPKHRSRRSRCPKSGASDRSERSRIQLHRIPVRSFRPSQRYR